MRATSSSIPRCWRRQAKRFLQMPGPRGSVRHRSSIQHCIRAEIVGLSGVALGPPATDRGGGPQRAWTQCAAELWRSIDAMEPAVEIAVFWRLAAPPRQRRYFRSLLPPCTFALLIDPLKPHAEPGTTPSAYARP